MLKVPISILELSCAIIGVNRNINDIDFPTKETVLEEYHKYLIRARDGHHDGIINNFLIKDFFIKQMKGVSNESV